MTRLWIATIFAALWACAALAQDDSAAPAGAEPAQQTAPAEPPGAPIPEPPPGPGDVYDPNPNRLPGPKHFTPETCTRAPEVCEARKEFLRRKHQECLDAGRTDCGPSPSAKAKKRKPAAETAPPAP